MQISEGLLLTVAKKKNIPELSHSMIQLFGGVTSFLATVFLTKPFARLFLLGGFRTGLKVWR